MKCPYCGSVNLEPPSYKTCWGWHCRDCKHTFQKKGGAPMTDPHKLHLLRRLFSNDHATRQAAMDDAAERQPLFSSNDELTQALATLAKENTEKGGDHNGQQRQQSPHQA